MAYREDAGYVDPTPYDYSYQSPQSLTIWQKIALGIGVANTTASMSGGLLTGPPTDYISGSLDQGQAVGDAVQQAQSTVQDTVNAAKHAANAIKQGMQVAPLVGIGLAVVLGVIIMRR